MSPTRYLTAILMFFTLAACSSGEGRGATGGAEQGAAKVESVEYVDAEAFLTDPAQADSWYQLMRQLKVDFEEVCGDSFCEGEYTDYESLSFRCSVEKGSGKVNECVWVLAASLEDISPQGEVKVQAKTWACKMPVSQSTGIVDLLATLTAVPKGGRAIEIKLPGSNASFYDGLSACL